MWELRSTIYHSQTENFVMTNREHREVFGTRLASFFALAILCAMLVAATPAAQAQTFTILHNFTGVPPDGANPYAGLTIDPAGNLYGTTRNGGAGNGMVYQLKHTNSGFVFRPLYVFEGGNDGAFPEDRLTIGPDGSFYGTTVDGGGAPPEGVGTVFNLKPPPAACKTALCPWFETVLLSFNQANGSEPHREVTFDQAGNLYGTVASGGQRDDGAVYELTPLNGGWTESTAYSFSGSDGLDPIAGVIFDNMGNLYSTTQLGGSCGYGTVFQLVPADGGWTESVLYSFAGGSDGGFPAAGLIFDPSGNLYGATTHGGTGSGGTVFELTPSNGSWIYSLVYSFSGPPKASCGPQGSLVMDGAGNLYGTTFCDGAHGFGSVFELTPSGGGWTYTALYDFTGARNGGYPYGSVVFDSNGNLYGTASIGGTGSDCDDGSLDGCGVVWEITP